MENKYRNLLRVKRMALCESMNSQNMMEDLVASNILTQSDIAILKTKTTNLKKNEKMLELLTRRGPHAFEAFLEALKKDKIAYLLGDEYAQQDSIHDPHDEIEGKDPSGNVANVKVNEEKPITKDMVVSPDTDITESPMREEFYDTVDVTVGHPADDAQKNVDTEEALDIDTDPGGKQARIEELFVYDTVDTPFIKSPENGHSTLTDESSQPKPGLMINTDSTDFPGLDATDSAPPSAASSEFEDGPFSRLSSQKAKDTPPTQNIDVVESSTFISHNYPMTRMPRGHFLIINNKDFLPESTMAPYPRNGTDLDADAMKSLFEELGYIVDYYRNATCSEMRRYVKKIANLDHSRSSAVGCCFLSHGKEGILYGTDGEIEIRDLTSVFRDKKGLVGKPKMFFFQACQGSDYMDSIEPDRGYMEVDGPGGDYGNDISLPTEADFIYAYSTVPGYYSWRNSQNGSWFIQEFVEACRKYAHKMDLIRILTRVNESVSSNKSRTGQRFSHNKRQVSSIITQLRYELYLLPPHGPLKEYRKR